MTQETEQHDTEAPVPVGSTGQQEPQKLQRFRFTGMQLVAGSVVLVGIGFGAALIAHNNSLFPFDSMHARWQIGEVQVLSDFTYQKIASLQTRTTTYALTDSVTFWIDSSGSRHEQSWPECLTPSLVGEVEFLGGDLAEPDGFGSVIVAGVDCRTLK